MRSAIMMDFDCMGVDGTTMLFPRAPIRLGSRAAFAQALINLGSTVVQAVQAVQALVTLGSPTG
jgi:hypothetical protein